MRASLLLNFIAHLVLQTYGDCIWNLHSTTLDLSCLKGRTITTEDQAGDKYTFTLCVNEAGICNAGDSVMCLYTKPDDDEDECYEVGRWDQSQLPTYDATTGWTFTYANGGACQGQNVRTFSPNFVCDSSVELRSGQVDANGMSCMYSLEVRTKYACPGAVCDAGAEGLSAGWIFVILVICLFITYCVAGYVVKALTVNKERGFGDVRGNVPNLGFWMALPALVVAGCGVSKEVTVHHVNRMRGKEVSDDHNDLHTNITDTGTGEYE